MAGASEERREGGSSKQPERPNGITVNQFLDVAERMEETSGEFTGSNASTSPSTSPSSSPPFSASHPVATGAITSTGNSGGSGGSGSSGGGGGSGGSGEKRPGVKNRAMGYVHRGHGHGHGHGGRSPNGGAAVSRPAGVITAGLHKHENRLLRNQRPQGSDGRGGEGGGGERGIGARVFNRNGIASAVLRGLKGRFGAANVDG